MASLLHIIDEEGLKNHPNLKFDPQNASAHLQFDHPKFQELKEGLTPEQIEILENVTQVDGFEVDGSDQIEDDIELIDPMTGEVEKDNPSEFSLDELGFIDPANLRKITLEAFDNHQLQHVQGLIQERYAELTEKGAELFHKRMISRLEANNVNALLGGRLYDNVVMESFTQMPTVVNYNVVMEEIDSGKAALAAGGAIIGVTILYKLVKWFLNSWNKNAVASGSIGANVKAIQERKDRLKNATDVVATAQQAFENAAKKLKDDVNNNKMSNRDNNKFAAIVKRIGSAENLKDNSASKEFLEALANENVRVNLAPQFSNLWLSIITNSAVQVGTGLQVNADFVSKMQAAVNACQSICNAAQAKIENISNTGANQAVDSDKDQTYQQAVQVIKAFAGACGYNLNESNFSSSAPEFSAFITTQVVAKLDKEVPEQTTQANITIFNEETFAVISDEFIKQVEAFGDTLKSTAGNGLFKKDKVNVGDAVQRDSRLTEYEKAASHFRGAMNVMRGVLAIRNNVGRGLVAMNSAYDFLGK